MTTTVLITGAGSGFGKATAIELEGRGHDVIATTETQAQADALAAEHPGLRTMKLDVTDPGVVASAAGDPVAFHVNVAAVGERLGELSENVIGLSTRTVAESQEVTILADRSVPFRVIKRVMSTCTSRGYGRISLAVLQKAAETSES